MSRTANIPASFGKYLSEIDRTPLLTGRDEKELAVRVLAGDAEARDRMVRSNLRLVVNIARGYLGKGLLIEDLVSEGNMGLIRAVEGFDPTMNTRFSTYASYWIRQSIKRGIVNTARTIRVPAYLGQLLARWWWATGELTDELGRPPTREEVAGRSGLSGRKLKIVAEAIRVSTAPQSDHGGDGPGIAETLVDTQARAPGGAMVEAEDIGWVLHRLAGMDRREAAVLRMRFGLGGEGPKTLNEIGERLGLTRERVRQIEGEALARLGGDAEAT